MFTDFLHNPINPGDVVVYPQAAGSSSAKIQMGRVLAIDPMVKRPDPRYGEQVFYESKQPKPGEYVSGPRWPGQTFRNQATGDWDFVPDNSKAYRLRMQRLEWDNDLGVWTEDGHPVWILNVDRVTVVTGLLA
jgi:hypothetical protein